MRVLGPVLLFVALLFVMVGGYWAYLTRTIDVPYDEMWIGLNGRMPGPLREWACRDVEARLGPAAVPPLGCEGFWG